MYTPCKITLTGDKNYARNFIGAAQSQMRILDSQMSFQNLKQGVRRVRFNSRTTVEAIICFGLKEVKIHCLPAIIKGIKKELMKLPNLYVYVTISDYVTIWDLSTGEVAEDVCDNDGNTITFPCHKNDLAGWLEGIPDKPTRQVLKDEPENNRDYLGDNGIDIGNENRVELANKWDPSYCDYYGVQNPPVAFTCTVRDEIVNTRDPVCCYTENCNVPLNYIYGTIIEKKSPSPETLIDVLPEEVADSFSCARNFENGKADRMATYYGPYRRCRHVVYMVDFDSSVEHIQKYFQRTKHLYLGPYPSPTYLRLEGIGMPSKAIEYSNEFVSAYNEAIDVEWDNTKFSDGHYLDTWDWLLKKDLRQGNVISINTKLGNLLIDYIPYRDWADGTERIYDRMRSATDDAFLSTYLKEGVCNSVSEWETRSELWPGLAKEFIEHAEDETTWCKSEARSAIDTRDSESNRNGISWCGSPTPRDEFDTEGVVIKEAKTQGWYRVILNFYMGGFHTGGHEASYNFNDSPFYCPNVEMCEDVTNENPSRECTATSWSNKLIERFSSVQATIELEKPKDYPKVKGNNYKRPDDYNGYEEDFTQLCAFPGRTQGISVKDDICYPFDGTYNIYTLGEAVEELINGHYEDGSDDQLLVYLYERPNMIEKEVT